MTQAVMTHLMYNEYGSQAHFINRVVSLPRAYQHLNEATQSILFSLSILLGQQSTKKMFKCGDV